MCACDGSSTVDDIGGYNATEILESVPGGWECKLAKGSSSSKGDDAAGIGMVATSSNVVRPIGATTEGERARDALIG